MFRQIEFCPDTKCANAPQKMEKGIHWSPGLECEAYKVTVLTCRPLKQHVSNKGAI